MRTERVPARYGQRVGYACKLRNWIGILGVLLFVCPLALASPAAGSPEDLAFFETHIRPVIAAHCYGCHGPERADAALRLDQLPIAMPDAAVKVLQQHVTDGHPAIALAAGERESIRAWIARGAPWPGATKVQPRRGSMDGEIRAMRSAHWAFRSVTNSSPPEDVVSEHPIDAFVRSRLAGEGLTPSPRASKDTLIRRAYHDLVGLPPTREAILAFEADGSSDAFDRLVDSLLASPHFGERWGRHWLDVARYSDTKGSSFTADRLFPFSHTYRDYVIRAFNEDLPYDQFIRHQLAADRMELGDDQRPLAALGFLTLGKTFGANIHDQIDDRIDVVMRGFQGLTVNCARCHDHKFDPIPTADYYSLYGVFRSSQEPDELPLIEAPDVSSPAYQDFRTGLDKVLAAESDLKNSLHVALLAHARSTVGTYLQGVSVLWSDDAVGGLDTYAKEHGLRTPLLERWREFLKADTQLKDPVFGFWRACMQLSPATFPGDVEVLLTAPAADDAPLLNSVLRNRLQDPLPLSMAAVNTIYGDVFNEIDRRWQDHLAAALQRGARNGAETTDLPTRLDDEGMERLRLALYGSDTPVNIPFDDVQRMSSTVDRNRINQRREAVELFKNSHPGRPNRAMALVDSPTLFDPYVFNRGDATNAGEKVPRRFLAVLSGHGREAFQTGSGRLDLANAIANKENPLTARVFVNRVWGHLFDQPIVGTPSDFGTQGNAPTHPALLDHLAWRFMAEDWSMKSLIRHIMLSETYRQASDLDAAGEEADPRNELLWRQNRRRLDFEVMRDSLLAAADNLDLSIGGYPTNITDTPYTNRRTVYAEVDRHALPAMFRIFDFATPNEHTPMRFETTVPQQALYLMNSEFVAEQARLAAAREALSGAEDDRSRVRALYHSLLKREPSEKELTLGQLFVQGQDVATKQPVPERDTTWRYGHGRVDEATGHVVGFEEFPHWTGEAFQEAAEMPGPSLGWAMLNRLGGHPGDAGHAVVRRWTAEADSLLSCVGELYHHASAGDGIRAYIISSRSGIVWEGDVQDGVIATVMDDVPVRVGDTVDLVVTCRENEEEDAFRWHPRLYLSGENAADFETQDWITRFDFVGPPPAPQEPLKPWEQYAQVLLMSNEFMFVD